MARWEDVAGGAALATLGVGVCVRAAALQIGTALDPQPGFFPFIGGVCLLVLALLLLAHAFWRGGPGRLGTERLGRPALVVLGLAIYTVLLEWAGYPLMTFLVTLLVLRVLDTRWVPSVLASVLLSLGSYRLFVKLGVPLPPGWFLGG